MVTMEGGPPPLAWTTTLHGVQGATGLGRAAKMMGKNVSAETRDERGGFSPTQLHPTVPI